MGEPGDKEKETDFEQRARKYLEAFVREKGDIFKVLGAFGKPGSKELRTTVNDPAFKEALQRYRNAQEAEAAKKELPVEQSLIDLREKGLILDVPDEKLADWIIAHEGIATEGMRYDTELISQQQDSACVVQHTFAVFYKKLEQVYGHAVSWECLLAHKLIGSSYLSNKERFIKEFRKDGDNQAFAGRVRQEKPHFFADFNQPSAVQLPELEQKWDRIEPTEDYKFFDDIVEQAWTVRDLFRLIQERIF